MRLVVRELAGLALLHELEVPDDRRQRRAELVRHHRDERLLHLVQLEQALVLGLERAQRLLLALVRRLPRERDRQPVGQDSEHGERAGALGGDAHGSELEPLGTVDLDCGGERLGPGTSRHELDVDVGDAPRRRPCSVHGLLAIAGRQRRSLYRRSCSSRCASRESRSMMDDTRKNARDEQHETRSHEHHDGERASSGDDDGGDDHRRDQCDEHGDEPDAPGIGGPVAGSYSVAIRGWSAAAARRPYAGRKPA